MPSRYDINHFSNHLWRNMNIRVYGTKGWPLLVFPTQDAMCDNYENFGMIDELSEFIDNGQFQLFCVDTVDQESWSDNYGDKFLRAERQENYYRYITEEVVPLIHEHNHSDWRPLTTGCSMGATHAAIVFLRRPDLFEGVIGFSGCYDAHYFYQAVQPAVHHLLRRPGRLGRRRHPHAAYPGRILPGQRHRRLV